MPAGAATTASRVNVVIRGAGEDTVDSLAVAPASVPSGPVTFVVRNRGRIGPAKVYGVANNLLVHELVVLKTSLPPGKLPRTSGKPGAINYTRAVEVGRVAPPLVVSPLRTRTVTLNLKPGHYVLISNLEDDYLRGAHAAFHVIG
jgi:hypothetical protein